MRKIVVAPHTVQRLVSPVRLRRVRSQLCFTVDTALHLAAKHSRLGAIDAVVEAGADVVSDGR